MARIGRYTNPALTIDWAPDEPPLGTTAAVVTLATPDRSATSGVLYRPPSRKTGVVALMHPRADVTRHYLIPALLRAGFAVWAQRSRNVNNDTTTVHEQLLIDIAVAHAFLDDLDLGPIFVLGNSGGAGLYCYYLQQAALTPELRVSAAPSGLPVDLTLRMPQADGLILLAPHPGQGELLMHCIDPAVADEADPVSVTAELDLFSPENGFCTPPSSSSYSEAFLRQYRAAQRDRVLRIDAQMRDLIAQDAALRVRAREGDVAAQRAANLGRFVTVYRTDADPRTVDLSLDPSARDYGSIFGGRPDVTNFGIVGFGRLTTPHAWLSTWSGVSSRAALRLTAPDIALATLVVSYTADNSVFPADVRAIQQQLTASDVSRIDIECDHFGYRPGSEERLLDGPDVIIEWLNAQI
jgi:hypothetical protein